MLHRAALSFLPGWAACTESSSRHQQNHENWASCLPSPSQVRDVPKEWNSRMQQYFGYQPPDDAKGCLQVCSSSAARTGPSELADPKRERRGGGGGGGARGGVGEGDVTVPPQPLVASLSTLMCYPSCSWTLVSSPTCVHQLFSPCAPPPAAHVPFPPQLSSGCALERRRFWLLSK